MKDVVISGYVWVGENAFIIKGISVGGGSIIGYGSIIAKDVLSMCAAADNPVKIIGRNIVWTRADKAELTSDNKKYSNYYTKLAQ